MAMNTPRRRLSPKAFAMESGLQVEHCAYHFGELADAGCIVLVDTKKRRGAVEHIYEALQTALAWTSEWEDLNPKVKRSVLTSVLGGGITALGRAVDNGTFEARDDSHLSWDTIELDEVGWISMSEILDRALGEILRVEREAAHRIDHGAEAFLVSYFLASFESPAKSSLTDGPLGTVSGGPPPLRPTINQARLKRRAARETQSEHEIMAKVLQNPIRVKILMSMNTPRRRMSPKLFAEEAGVPAHKVAYHFQELEDTGCIALVEIQQRRGVVEHIYEPLKAAIQWTDDWKGLGPAIKQGVLASVMRGAVEALGLAIESGTFEARSASHMSFGTIKVDEAAWSELANIFDGALDELIELEREALERISAGDPFFPASYLMASFEAPKLGIFAGTQPL
jgi:hypothetical protein